MAGVPAILASSRSLHDALPIYSERRNGIRACRPFRVPLRPRRALEDPPSPNATLNSQPTFVLRPLRAVLTPSDPSSVPRSEEHTSELQSHVNLVCRLLLEKKKK